jgi:hypothetical protein
MFDVCSSKHGVLAETGTVHVHVTDVNILKALAAAIITARQFPLLRDVNIPYVQQECFHVAAQNVPHVPDVLAMSMDLI